MADLFVHQNYREYLREYYNEQKALKKNFSYRSFSEKAGIAAPSFLFHVIEGKRNLTKNSVIKVSRAIGHTRDEAEFLKTWYFSTRRKPLPKKPSFTAGWSKDENGSILPSFRKTGTNTTPPGITVLSGKW